MCQDINPLSMLRPWRKIMGLPAMLLPFAAAGEVDWVGFEAHVQRKLFCRIFSDPTTTPRSGLVSGCYPPNYFYKQRPEAGQLAEAKRSK